MSAGQLRTLGILIAHAGEKADSVDAPFELIVDWYNGFAVRLNRGDRTHVFDHRFNAPAEFVRE